MDEKDLLKKAEALAKKISQAQELYDEASGAAKAEAKAMLTKLQESAKAIGKKAQPAMQNLKKAGEAGSKVFSFFSNPLKFGLDQVKEVVSHADEIGSALKKGYDFSRKLDAKIAEGAKKVLPKVGEAAADAMTGGLYSAGKAVYEKGKDMVDLSAADAKRKKDAEVRAKKNQQSAKLPGGATEIKIQQGAKKGTYAEAKKKDPKLDSYIAARKKLKKGSPEYNKIQGKINAAYGVGGRQVTPEKVEKRTVTEVKREQPKAELGGAPKSQTAAKPAVVKKKTTTDAGGRDAAKMVADEIKGDAPISKKKEPSRRERNLLKKLEKERLKKKNKGGKIKAYNTGGITDPPKGSEQERVAQKELERKARMKKEGNYSTVQQMAMKGQMPTDERSLRELIDQAEKEKFATSKGKTTGALMYKGGKESAADYYDNLLAKAKDGLAKARMEKRRESESKKVSF